MHRSGKSGNAVVRWSSNGRATLIAGTMVALAAVLTACQSEPGKPARTTPSPVSTVSSPSANPTPAPTVGTASPAPTAVKTPSTPSEGPATPAEAVTIITLETRDGFIQASGIVPAIVESDGVCTLTISHDGVTRSQTAPAAPGRDSTYCGLVSIDVAGLASGAWDAVLSYRSPKSAADSTSMQVQVP